MWEDFGVCFDFDLCGLSYPGCIGARSVPAGVGVSRA